MGSRIMHLAIGNKLKDLIDIKDYNRFNIGCILPDANTIEANSRSNSHYKVRICNGEKKTYDLNKFRIDFQDKILVDDLYLGYYMHLVQDVLYRKFIYDTYKWNPYISENVNKLHNDYALLNSYIIEKYNIENNLTMPKNFNNESINKIHSFDVKLLLNELKFDFNLYDTGSIFFFTKEMAEEYIDSAVQVCADELNLLKENKPSLKVLDYMWK